LRQLAQQDCFFSPSVFICLIVLDNCPFYQSRNKRNTLNINLSFWTETITTISTVTTLVIWTRKHSSRKRFQDEFWSILRYNNVATEFHKMIGGLFQGRRRSTSNWCRVGWSARRAVVGCSRWQSARPNERTNDKGVSFWDENCLFYNVCVCVCMCKL
jgi:hypothetical protein